MKHFVVAIQDRAMQAYNRPFHVPAIGAAMRSFTDETNRAAPDNQMYVHPEDFELWLLGTFEDTTGQYEQSDVRCLARGKEVSTKKQEN